MNHDGDFFEPSPFEDRLLINDGDGFFSDETVQRLTQSMTMSQFGITAIIDDVNLDGSNDIIKHENGIVEVLYNGGAGFFVEQETVFGGAAYFCNAGDLNNDGRIDLVVSDYGNDRYLINNGLGPSGLASFTQFVLPSVGEAGNSLVVDLNGDGHQDVIITDVDQTTQGCFRPTYIYRNNGVEPHPTLQEIGQVVPPEDLHGVHDVAVFDLNGDGTNDIILGTCIGTQVWINQPPIGLALDFPNGLPAMLTSEEETVFTVVLTDDGAPVADGFSVVLHVSVDGAAFTESKSTPQDEGAFLAQLPALPCTTPLAFYFGVEDQSGQSLIEDPCGAPELVYEAIAASGFEIAYINDFESAADDWTVESEASLTDGAWEVATPNGSLHGGSFAAPPDDATEGVGNHRAFVTRNGPLGADAGDHDVDDGPTSLISPSFDLAGTDGSITFSRWYFCHIDFLDPWADSLVTEVSNDDGESWVVVDELTTTGTSGVWERVSFTVSEYVEPTATVHVRFSTDDTPNDTVTEAGIDDFQLERFICGASCPADLDGSGDVVFTDLLILLAAWNTSDSNADLDASGTADFVDLLLMLDAWGDCD